MKRAVGLWLEHLLYLTPNLEASLRRSFPAHMDAALEGEHKVRPYENLVIVFLDGGSLRTPSRTHI